MTNRESPATKASQTIRRKLLARLPATPASLPRAYRRFLAPLEKEGLIRYHAGSATWQRATTEDLVDDVMRAHPLTAPHARDAQSACTFKGCRAPHEYPGHGHATGRGDELVPTRVAQPAQPQHPTSTVVYGFEGITVIQPDQDIVFLKLHPGPGGPQWMASTLTAQIQGGPWAYVDSPQGILLTRPPVFVNEVARETRTVDITLTLRVTTTHHSVAEVASLVLASLDAGPNRPMEFIDGDITALGTSFKINDWSEVPRG